MEVVRRAAAQSILSVLGLGIVFAIAGGFEILVIPNRERGLKYARDTWLYGGFVIVGGILVTLIKRFFV